ncbi:hypothetical protein AND_008113 [Anopheles darlingi]|uniref:Microtubule-associated protein n=1 Tax=Anopheles darlingi TaxID=43151 RepID=W5JBN8_ANODA|nr:hypothetical protein AND_008113 [Anopheles darlingi]
MDLQPKLAAAEAKPSVLLSSSNFFGNNQPTPPSPAAPVVTAAAAGGGKPALGPSPLASTPQAPVLSSVAPQQFPLQPVPQFKPQKPQPAQVRFLSDQQQQQQRPAEIRFAPAPLKVPLVRPLLPAGGPQPPSIPPSSIRPSFVPNTAYLMDQPPRPPNPTGGPVGPQMMRPPMGPPRTGTPTQPQPGPRPGPMFVGGQHPPGVPMPMRPQMPPGTGVPGMQPRPPSGPAMQRPPMMMGQPSPIRPPPQPVMSGPRPTISPQNSNLGGVGIPQQHPPQPGAMGQARPPQQQPHQQGAGSPYGPGSPDPQGGAGSPFGLQQGPGPNNSSRPPSTNMRPAYYPNRPPMGAPIGGDQQSRPPSGVDGSGLPSATHSIDDDDDVVIGKITPESPNPARGPPRNFTMPGPGTGPYPMSGEREKSIPSRPPSVAGNYKSSAELDPNDGPGGGGARPMHALKDFIQKDQQARGPSSPGQSPSPGSQQLSPANTDENFSYRPGSKPHGQQQPQQQYKMAPGSQPSVGPGRDGEKVTFQMPNGAGGGPPQDWNGRSRPPLQQQPMARNPPMGAPMKPSADQHHKGDNDSGVDEYTQEKDRPNAPTSPASPLKSPSKIPGLARRPDNIASESRSRSTSKQRANAKTPETPSEQPLIKKVPMNKIQVGGTPSPNLKVVKSKIGSLENTSHKPGGGHVKIETKKLDIKASARIEAKNDAYIPKGGDKKIISTKLQWNAKPKIGSLDNAAHKPGGGDKRIESIKTDFKERAKPKIGSKDNLTYKPGGGDVKIVHQKLDIKAESKIGSLDNLKHKPGGGDKKIFDDKEYLKNIEHPITPSPSTQVKSGAGSVEDLLE